PEDFVCSSCTTGPARAAAGAGAEMGVNDACGALGSITEGLTLAVGDEDKGGGTARLPEPANVIKRSCNLRLSTSELRDTSAKSLGIKSSAPAANASRVILAPSYVSDENIRIGTLRLAIMCLMAVRSEERRVGKRAGFGASPPKKKN